MLNSKMHLLYAYGVSYMLSQLGEKGKNRYLSAVMNGMARRT